MITKQLAFLSTDGQLFATRDGAQEHALNVLLKSNDDPNTSIARFIIDHKPEVLAILADRKPRTTKAKAKRAKRNAATPATTTATATQSAEAYDPTNND